MEHPLRRNIFLRLELRHATSYLIHEIKTALTACYPRIKYYSLGYSKFNYLDTGDREVVGYVLFPPLRTETDIDIKPLLKAIPTLRVYLANISSYDPYAYMWNHIYSEEHGDTEEVKAAYHQFMEYNQDMEDQFVESYDGEYSD